jgi:hypothetical protein
MLCTMVGVYMECGYVGANRIPHRNTCTSYSQRPYVQLHFPPLPAFPLLSTALSPLFHRSSLRQWYIHNNNDNTLPRVAQKASHDRNTNRSSKKVKSRSQCKKRERKKKAEASYFSLIPPPPVTKRPPKDASKEQKRTKKEQKISHSLCSSQQPNQHR